MNKKTLDYYMDLPYKMELTPDEEGGYVLSFPDLPGCLSCAETLDEIGEMANDAKRVWFQSMLEDGKAIPEPAELHQYSGQLRLRMPKGLHRRIALKARDEQISLNQYCIYLLSSALDNNF